jgi:hypothetical protein
MQRNKLWFVALVTLVAVSARAQNTFPASGNVGIGTTTPAVPLDVSGSSMIARFGASGSGNDNWIHLVGSSQNWDLGATSANYFGIAEAGVAYRLVVVPGGGVGVGTLTPIGKLSVSSSDAGVWGDGPTAWTSAYSLFGPNAGNPLGAALAISYSTTDDMANITSLAPTVAWKPLRIAASQINLATSTGNGGTSMFINSSGNVGIGTTNPQYKLSVNGTIQAKEVIVNTGWADYVFQADYRVRPLTELAAFIKANHHLPDIPSETEIKDKGVSLGDMQTKLLAKIEELTLQMIQLDEKNRTLKKRVAQIQAARVAGSGRNGGK